MTLYVARHGETEWNVRDAVCGRTDLPLTERGRAQARELAQKCAGREIRRIFTSPLLRARDTAAAVARATGAPVTVDGRLIEQDFGCFESCSRLDPDYVAFRRDLAVRFPGGESCAQVIARVYAFLEERRAEALPGGVLLVTHGGVCRAVHTYFYDLTNEAYFDFRLANCELRIYEL